MNTAGRQIKRVVEYIDYVTVSVLKQTMLATKGCFDHFTLSHKLNDSPNYYCTVFTTKQIRRIK